MVHCCETFFIVHPRRLVLHFKNPNREVQNLSTVLKRTAFFQARPSDRGGKGRAFSESPSVWNVRSTVISQLRKGTKALAKEWECSSDKETESVRTNPTALNACAVISSRLLSLIPQEEGGT
jgi:hypothetical protein